MKKENIKFHKAKKNFGQNFLKSNLALNKIVEGGKVEANEIILEIGPGKGALTSKLLEKGAIVIAIEKDRDLIPIIEERFHSEIQNGKLILINQDILELNLSEMQSNFFSDPRFSSLTARPDHDKKFFAFPPYKIIANIPYNITGAILKKFLTENMQPSLMVLMVQNEVAKRIVANDKKESILSISVKAYGKPKNLMKVSKKYFSPPPKVDSAIILIDDINKDLFNKENIKEENFWKIVHAGFSHKRKVLLSNLKNFDKNTNWQESWNKLNLKEKVRAEDLDLNDWVKIVKSIS